MAKYPGLIKRGAIYWHRKQVPADVQPVIGQKEIKRSLGTSGEREAIVRYHEVAAETEKQISDARAALNRGDWPQRSEQEIELIAHDWWTVARQDLDGPLAQSKPRFYDEDDLVAHLAAYLAENGINIPIDSTTFDRIRTAARFEAGVYTTDVVRLTTATARAEANLRQGREEQDRPPSPVRPVNGVAASAKRVDDHSISDMLARYLGERKLDPKSAGEWTRAIRLFREQVGGNVMVTAINKQMVRDFKDALLKMPKSMPNNVRQLPLPEIISLCDITPELGQGRKALPTTVNKLLSALSSVLDYAEINGYIDENPARGIRALDPERERRKRQNYSVADLTLIFSSGCYQRPPMEAAQRSADFWLPLLALWTGARLEELGQALVCDVCDNVPFPYFDINEIAEGSSLKTPESKRRVPLQTELSKCGFLDYVKGLRKRGETRLFPELEPNRHGFYTQSFSTRWARFTDRIGIDDPRKVFHSFRHGFIDACRANRLLIPESVEKALVGHANGEVHAMYGSTGYPLHVLAEAIKLVSYPGLDLSHLHINDVGRYEDEGDGV